MNKVAEYASPKFYDKKVQEINTDLRSLGWIENIYPIAQTGVDEEGTFPEVYKNDGSKQSVRVLPSGVSMSFFTLEDPVQKIDDSDMYQVTLSLTVWADMAKVYPNKGNNYTVELLNDILGVIDDNDGYNELIEQREVFAEYTQLEKIENQNVMLPNTAFKVTFMCDMLPCQ